MGLDVAFDRAQAIEAGLEVFVDTHGTHEDIAHAEQDPHGDPDYLAWLKEESEYIRVPGIELVTHTDSGDRIIVRANKWGQVYGPLTTWLTTHNINWEEF